MILVPRGSQNQSKLFRGTLRKRSCEHLFFGRCILSQGGCFFGATVEMIKNKHFFNDFSLPGPPFSSQKLIPISRIFVPPFSFDFGCRVDQTRFPNRSKIDSRWFKSTNGFRGVSHASSGRFFNDFQTCHHIPEPTNLK